MKKTENNTNLNNTKLIEINYLLKQGIPASLLTKIYNTTPNEISKAENIKTNFNIEEAEIQENILQLLDSVI